MADEFVQLVPLENGETEELGQHLNDSFEALEVAANLSLRYRRDVNDGEWNGATPYKLGDVVFWADAYWHALAANAMSEPDSENTNWRKIGGDGGGGHVIKKADGNSMTQRAGLQFEGDDVSLSDDAAGNKTKVSIARKIAVYLAGVAKGVQGKLNFVAGSNTNITVVENAETGFIDVTINATTTATQWRRGEGAPSNSLGINGDFYLDTNTFTAYQKSGGSYSSLGTFKGAQGIPGPQGAPGTVNRDGAGLPDDAVGIDGDTWTVSSGEGKGDVYRKESGTYVLRYNIKGADGADGTDAIAPDLIAFAGGVDGQPEPLTYVMTVPCIQPFRLPEGLAGSAFWCRLDPTEDAQYIVYKGYAAGGAEQIGTFTYEANPGGGGGGGAGAAVTFNDEIDFAVGDCLIVYSPPVTDATMRGASWTLKGVLL